MLPSLTKNTKKNAPNPCEAKDKCGWNGKSVGCTIPGCFGPAIFRMKGLV